MIDSSNALTLIESKCLARVVIPLEDGGVIKACITHSYCQPTGPSEQFDATHSRTS